MSVFTKIRLLNFLGIRAFLQLVVSGEKFTDYSNEDQHPTFISVASEKFVKNL